MSVDGFNVFAFSELRQKDGPYQGAPLYDMVLIPPKESIVIPGWHRTNTTSVKFKITEYAETAAAKMSKATDIGTITATFCTAWEKTPPDDEPPNACEPTTTGRALVSQQPRITNPCSGRLGPCARRLPSATRCLHRPNNRTQASSGQILRFGPTKRGNARGLGAPPSRRPDRALRAREPGARRGHFCVGYRASCANRKSFSTSWWQEWTLRRQIGEVVTLEEFLERFSSLGAGVTHALGCRLPNADVRSRSGQGP